MPWGAGAYGTEVYGAEGQAPTQEIEITAGIASEEVVGQPSIQFGIIPTSIASEEVVGSPSIGFSILVQGIASEEVVGQPSLGFIVEPTSIPSEEVVGTPAAQFIIAPTSIPSGEAFGEDLIVQVNYIPGWTLRAFSLDNAVVANIPRWKGLKFQKVLSGEGSAEVTVPLEDALEIDLLDRELIWRVFYDGKFAFSWLTEAVDEEWIKEGAREVPFAGRGSASMLEWGTVLPPGYPSHTTREWSWTDARAMKVWRDLFAACQARGVLPLIQTTFSDAADSSGAAWTDVVDLAIEPGGNMLDMLQRLSAMAGADWLVTPGLTVDVKKDYGAHRENSVRFQVARDQLVFNRGRDRKELRNVAYVEGSQGGIREAQDNASITTWGRREVYLQAGEAISEDTVGLVAQQTVALTREEKIQITCSVLADSPDRKVFEDYDVGDWVGMESDEVEVRGDFKIRAISVEVNDNTGAAKVELALQSLMELEAEKIAKLAQAGGGTISAPGSTQTPLTPPGIINAVILSPPPNAPTGLDLDIGANENRVYIDVSWVTVPPSGADPVVEYEVELERVGAGVVQAVRAVQPPVRLEPVEPNTQYSVRVRAISRMGRSSAYSATETVTTGADATIPGQASGLDMGAGISTVTIVWNENSEIDVKDGNGTYDIQLDTANTFNTANLRGKRVSGTITSFTDLSPATTYYARVRAVDSSGNVGTWSTTDSVTTRQAGTADIADLAIDSAKIASAAITTAKIADAQITTAKVLELSASKISAGTITAAAITLGSGGLFRAGRSSSPFHYLLLDENGIRFYKNGSSQFSGGTLTLELNTATGNAEFKGDVTGASISGSTISGNTISGGSISGTTISGGSISGTTITGTTITGSTFKTAASGTRVELNNATSQMLLYSGAGIEAGPAILTSAVFGGTDYLELYIGSPYRSGNSRAYMALRDNGWTGSANVKLDGREIELAVAAGNKVKFYSSLGDMFSARTSGSEHEFLFYYPPFLGGLLDIGIHGTSQQLGYVSSSAQFKEDIVPLRTAGLGENENPIWRVRPTKFKWKTDQVANAEEENLRNPEGQAGFIAEQLAEVSSDLVTLDRSGLPMGVDRNALLAYAVDGLQHCHEGLARRVECENELRAMITQLDDRLDLIEVLTPIRQAISKEFPDGRT